jgi:hypothetical protein
MRIKSHIIELIEHTVQMKSSYIYIYIYIYHGYTRKVIFEINDDERIIMYHTLLRCG